MLLVSRCGAGVPFYAAALATLLCTHATGQELLFKSETKKDACNIFAKNLSAGARKAIAAVKEQPDLPIKKSELVPASLVYWTLKNAAISWEEEVGLAKEKNIRIGNKQAILKAPARLQELAAPLKKNLPANWPEKDFEIKLLSLQEPATFSSGGGLILLSTGLVELLEQTENGKEMLQFVIAREMAHCVLGHCNQRLFFESKQKKLEESKDPTIKDIKRTLRLLAHREGFKLAPQQQYFADLFAAHLCRNSAVDLDKALDFLRRLVVCELAEGLGKPRDEGNDLREASLLDYTFFPPALLRLQALENDRNGRAESPEFGLFRVDVARKKTNKVTQQVKEQNVLIFVHGMLGGQDTFKEFLQTKHPIFADKSVAVLVFRYPNNASLARSGEFLFQAVREHVPAKAKVVFVCHSAGGLVARYAVEIKGLRPEKMVFLGVPSDGSSLAKLKIVADLNDLIPGIVEIGLPAKLRQVIREGSGEIGIDLDTGSLFLQFLDRGRPAPDDFYDNYYVFYGRILEPILGIAVGTAFNMRKDDFTKKMLANANVPFLLEEGLAIMKKTGLPHEVLFGDGVVTVASALKTPCRKSNEHRYSLNHDQLVRDQRVITRVLDVIGKQ